MKRAAVLICVLGLALVGCARKTSIPASRPETPIASSSAPPDGKASFTFIADPSVSPPKVTAHQELVAPNPIGRLVAAIYPAPALAAGADPASVYLRIVIGDDGFVSDVQDSPLGRSTPSPFAGEFRAAAEIAVRRWRFTPGHIDQYEDGQDVDADGSPDSKSLMRTNRIRVFYDVRFDFEIVAGKGRVRSSAGPH